MLIGRRLSNKNIVNNGKTYLILLNKEINNFGKTTGIIMMTVCFLKEGFMKAKNNSLMKFSLMWANRDWVDIHPYTLASRKSSYTLVK